MDFVTSLSVFTNWKSKTYNSILVIIDQFIKMVYHKLVKIIIDALSLTKVIIKMVVWHHGLFNSIISNCGLVFILKFWLLLCYFLKIKKKQSIVFYFQTNGQTEGQNNIIKAYFQAFINYKQNNWARLLLMTRFAYNNMKNASTSYILFELSCDFYFPAFYKKNINP